MKALHKIPIFLFIILISNCESAKDDCFKTITIPQFYMVNNQSYSYNTTLEVPCDFPEPENPKEISAPIAENFSYEVLNFDYIKDTGNNTSKLEFKIKLINSNNFTLKGIPVLTIDAGSFEFSTNYSNSATVSCNEISANSSCTLTYSQEESLDIGVNEKMELLDIKFYLTN